jgi:hypothetical protein
MRVEVCATDHAVEAPKVDFSWVHFSPILSVSLHTTHSNPRQTPIFARVISFLIVG